MYGLCSDRLHRLVLGDFADWGVPFGSALLKSGQARLQSEHGLAKRFDFLLMNSETLFLLDDRLFKILDRHPHFVRCRRLRLLGYCRSGEQ